MTCDFSQCQVPNCEMDDSVSCLDDVDFSECLEGNEQCLECAEGCLGASSSCDAQYDAMHACAVELDSKIAQCRSCSETCGLENCDDVSVFEYPNCVGTSLVDCFGCPVDVCRDMRTFSCEVRGREDFFYGFCCPVDVCLDIQYALFRVK